MVGKLKTWRRQIKQPNSRGDTACQESELITRLSNNYARFFESHQPAVLFWAVQQFVCKSGSA